MKYTELAMTNHSLTALRFKGAPYAVIRFDNAPHMARWWFVRVLPTRLERVATGQCFSQLLDGVHASEHLITRDQLREQYELSN